MNFMKDFEIQARERPTAPALHCDGVTHTYGDLMKTIDSCGLALKKTGVEPGERVALMMNNRVEFVVAYQAAVKIGAIIVPINTFLKESELCYQLKDIEPKVFIGNDWSALSIGPIKDEIKSLKEIVLTGVDEYTDFNEFVSSEKGELEMYEADDDETAVIKFTAGTTGKSKGAMQTHGNITRFTSDTMDIRPIQPDECILLFVPMFHGFGDHCCMNLVFKVGASYVAMDPFDPDKILGAIQDYRCTYFGCTPSMLYGLLYHPEVDKYDLSSLSRVLTGGGPVSLDLVKSFKDRFGVEVLQGYGLTEGCAGYTYTRIGMAFKDGSCGIVLPTVELKIIDINGKELPAGEPGEIIARSPYNMKGYWRKPDKTEDTVKDGWLHTGDFGKLDEDGYLFLIDRLKDMIIMSGENIYPTEIENAILEHPAIAQAAVIGAPDERRGEVPCAVIILNEGKNVTEAELIEYLKPKLASFKLPRKVKFRKDMPLSAQFKVLKRKLRDEYFSV